MWWVGQWLPPYELRYYALVTDLALTGLVRGETYRREKQVNDFYDGKCPNPLLFLRAHNIHAVVIWSEDQISDEMLDKLKIQPADYYEYRDFRGTPDEEGWSKANAGLFVRNARGEAPYSPLFI